MSESFDIVIGQPSALEECDACSLFLDELEISRLLRCSVCKNRFFCSAKCQKADWKSHKFDCSPLPADASPSSSIDVEDPQFSLEVARAAQVVQTWFDGYKEAEKENKDPNPSSVKGAKTFRTFELPPNLQYSRQIKQSDQHPFRAPLAAILRLLFVDLVTRGMSADERFQFSKMLQKNRNSMPSSYPALYGPKIVTHPADLAPGEYEMLLQLMPMYVAIPRAESGETKESADKESKGEGWRGWVTQAVTERWIALSVAQEKLYNIRSKPKQSHV